MTIPHTKDMRVEPGAPSLLTLILPIVAAVVAVSLNTDGRRLERAGFTVRVIIVTVVGSVAVALLSASPFGPVLAPFLGALAMGCIAYWAVARLRDMNDAAKYKAVITAVPFLGLIYVFYLMVARGAEPSSTEEKTRAANKSVRQ